MVSKTHFCPKCGQQMQKVIGTKGQYRCKSCGATINTKRTKKLGDYL